MTLSDDRMTAGPPQSGWRRPGVQRGLAVMLGLLGTVLTAALVLMWVFLDFFAAWNHGSLGRILLSGQAELPVFLVLGSLLCGAALAWVGAVRLWRGASVPSLSGGP
ncbi:hypothetical protein ACFQDE_03810 [Deinococcus caeni]|uniref:Uncharacterized protein n=1 Tax=Deinococcus caeni TaxID=569127 RepID=A0ABP9UD08_9DEIO